MIYKLDRTLELSNIQEDELILIVFLTLIIDFC